MNITFIDSLPSTCTGTDSFLRDKGFSCKEQNTCDSVRWRHYFKDMKKDCSNVMIRVVLRFEFSISDSPTATYDENHDLSFNDAYLTVFDRQRQQDGLLMGEPWYDDGTESLRQIDRFPIAPKTFKDITRLCELLA